MKQSSVGGAPDDVLAGMYAGMVSALRDFAHTNGFTAAVLGLSGGLDSAIAATIAAKALGQANVIGVSMPSRYSSKGSVDDALALARNLGIRIESVPIQALVSAYEAELAGLFAGTKSGLAEENLQARIRGTILMALSNKFGWLVLPPSNKSEIMTGYCTLYGDTCGALFVLGDVYKTRLYSLARWINREREIIPQATIDKPPSAELAPGQQDSDSLPPYEVLDAILELYLEKKLDAGAIAAHGYDLRLAESVIRLVERSAYKRRQMPPVLRLELPRAGAPEFFDKEC